MYSASERTIRWIPKRGQAGSYDIVATPPVPGSPRHLLITVNAISEVALAAGPAPQYRDDDVGYVFVHGMGTVDRCVDRVNLADYWGATPSVLQPQSVYRNVLCYDSRAAVADQAALVAQQIVNAQCGKFNRCIVVTHSMGGLMMEHLFTHDRAAVVSDPVPSMFAQRDLYRSAKDKVLFVISLASAAGGSKTADIVEHPETQPLGPEVVGDLAQWMGETDGATANLNVAYASTVVAPIGADPGVPFFMVPGFSVSTATNEYGDIWSDIGTFLQIGSDRVFNGDTDLALVDIVTGFGSRSDGLVDLRSSCGVASANWADGPGSGDFPLSSQLAYCANAPKKASHYVWFTTNLNHYLIDQAAAAECFSKDNPCFTAVPVNGAFYAQPQYANMTAVQVMRAKLALSDAAKNRMPAQVLLGP